MSHRALVLALALAVTLNACGYADLTGAQPTETLRQEASEAAEAAPTLTSVEPAHGSGSVDVEAAFLATFSEPVSVDAAQVQLLVDGAVAAATVAADASAVTLTPQTSLPYAATVEVRFAPGAISSLLGQPFAGIGADEWKVTTQANPDTTAPVVLWNAPGSLTSSDKRGINAHDAAKQMPVVIPIRLSEQVSVVDPNGIVLSICGTKGCIPQATAFELAGPDTLEVQLANRPLELNRDYQLVIEPGALADAAGNPITRQIRYFRFEVTLTLPPSAG